MVSVLTGQRNLLQRDCDTMPAETVVTAVRCRKYALRCSQKEENLHKLLAPDTRVTVGCTQGGNLYILLGCTIYNTLDYRDTPARRYDCRLQRH